MVHDLRDDGHMDHKYSHFMGRTYRVDLRQPYRRRRFVLVMVAACVIGAIIGTTWSIALGVPDADDMGCYDPGTVCYEEWDR